MSNTLPLPAALQAPAPPPNALDTAPGANLTEPVQHYQLSSGHVASLPQSSIPALLKQDPAAKALPTPGDGEALVQLSSGHTATLPVESIPALKQQDPTYKLIQGNPRRNPVPQKNQPVTATPDASEPDTPWMGRAVTGALEHFKAPFQQAYQTAVEATEPPKDYKETIAHHLGGYPTLAAYRASRAVVNGVENAIKAKPDEYNQATQDFLRTVQDFQNKKYGNAALSTASTAADLMGLTPGGELAGQKVRQLSESAKPGGDFAGTLAGDLTDLGMAYIGGRSPELTRFDPENVQEIANAGKTHPFFNTLTLQGHPLEELEGAINKSLGANKADVTYGSPARGLIREGITSMRNSGRLAEVTQKLDQLNDQLEKNVWVNAPKVPGSTSEIQKISMLDTVGDTLDKAKQEVANIVGKSDREVAEQDLRDFEDKIFGKNSFHEAGQADIDRATKEADQVAALHDSQPDYRDVPKIGDRVLDADNDLLPSEAHELKQTIGETVSNWVKNARATHGVIEDTARNLYGDIKQAISDQVPGYRDLNERISDLIAAKRALVEQAKAIKAGQAGVLTNLDITHPIQSVKKLVGNVAPGGIWASQKASPIVGSALRGAAAVNVIAPPNATHEVYDEQGNLTGHVVNGAYHPLETQNPQ